MSYDNACKYLAEKYPREFVRWLLAVEPKGIEVLKTELILEPIRADSVTFLRTTQQILHLEFQTQPRSNPPLPLRMLDYSIRLKRQYRCPVVQIVIFLQETTNEMAFTEEYQDETTVHRYRSLRLWEEDPAIFLNNLALLPLASLTRTDSPRNLLEQVAQKIVRISDRRQRQNLAGCTEILAGLRFEKDLIRQFLREEMMQESVIYQDILLKGRQEGRQQEAQAMAMRLLNLRLGGIEGTLLEQIRVLSIEQLEALIEELFKVSTVEDLQVWLQQQERN